MIHPIAEAPRLLAAGLIDLDATFLAQLGIFLVLLVAMKLVVYDPFLKVADHRREATDGARERASAAEREAAELGAQLERALREARREGLEVRNGLAAEGQSAGQAEVESLREDLGAHTDREMNQLAAAEAGARAALHTEARRLADRIADRILGAT